MRSRAARDHLARTVRELRASLGDEPGAAILVLRLVALRMLAAARLPARLAAELPGLFDEPLAATPKLVRAASERLDRSELGECWADALTLGWVFQYWNDPEREALDARLHDDRQAKLAAHEIASKTQMFTERYLVDWLLQNSLGPLWLAMCKRCGWTPVVVRRGTLARLERRRAAGQIAAIELDAEERRWAYYVPQPLPEDAIAEAPASLRELRLLDPAVGCGHFLLVAFELLVALYREEARHRRQRWSDVEIVESILENNLHGIDLDPRAVMVAAAGLWIRAQIVARGARPRRLNLVASSAIAELGGAGQWGSLLKLDGRELGDRRSNDAAARFRRINRESRYHLVVGNPPYQATAKLVDSRYIDRHYPRGRFDLYSAFIERSLELARPGGAAALLTMRSWMFIKQYARFRAWLFESHDLRCLGDFGRGAFEDIDGEVVSVVASVIRRASPAAVPGVALRLTGAARARHKHAAALGQLGRHELRPAALRAVPGWPLVYWWTPAMLASYATAPRVGEVAPLRAGMQTANNARFLRRTWELDARQLSLYLVSEPMPERRELEWVPYTTGARGLAWIDPLTIVMNWSRWGLEKRVLYEYKGSNGGGNGTPSIAYYLRPCVSYSMIGNNFAARAHRYRSLIGDKGAAAFPASVPEFLCAVNRSEARAILLDLNPSVSFQTGDVRRLPYRPVAEAEAIWAVLEAAFLVAERAREPAVEFVAPGPTPWPHAQAWAQRAVDRPAGAPLPVYEERLTPEPASDHLSYALGVALGRFGGGPGLAEGTLFLDGTLAPDDESDGLGEPATALLRRTWQTHRPAGCKRDNLRDWLRLEFFAIHRSMYQNRPIHWPLSSIKKTFVAWINIHRWHAGTLDALIARDLEPAARRLGGRSAARAELERFIADVRQCARRGPPPAEPAGPPRERDAIYDPVLADGVMINAAALWPVLDPQWKQPRIWWRELCEARGRKDYDWSRLAARYFPARVAAKCRADPSLAVAHGCFGRDHPALARAWEQRLRAELGPDFELEPLLVSRGSR